MLLPGKHAFFFFSVPVFIPTDDMQYTEGIDYALGSQVVSKAKSSASQENQPLHYGTFTL